MDVVPAFIAIDGVRFPLAANDRGVRIANDARFPGLEALSLVAAHLIARRSGAERVTDLLERKTVTRPQALVASIVDDDNRNDLGDGVENWIRLAGHQPDLTDAYLVSTLFLDDVLVVPRHTLIQLIEQVGALQDAVLGRELEPRTADVDPAQLIVHDHALENEAPEASLAEDEHPEGVPEREPSAPNHIADDDILRDIETLAEQVDDLDAAARQGERLYASVERSAAAAAKRHRLFIELEVAGLLEPTLAVHARAALSRLGLTRALGYHDAARALSVYLASPERASRFPGDPVPRVTAAYVSLDWFRTPSGYRPDGVTEHEWLALCEKNFARSLPSFSAGERFVQLCGSMHQLLYRAEIGPLPCLWRAVLAA